MKSVPRDLAAGAVVIALVLLAFSPWWVGHRLCAPLDVLHELYAPWNQGVTAPEVHNHFTSDALTQYLVYQRVAERSYDEDGFVGWSDLTGGGRPEYANTMALYGDWTMQLHRLLGFWTAWHLGLMAQFILAGLGMLVLLRSQGISRGIGVVGAIAYAANTQFVLWAYHRWQLGAFAWVPWLAWAVLTHASPRRRTWFLAPLFLALALLGGNLQTNAFTLLVVPALWLGTGRKRPWHFLAWTTLGLGLAAFALLPDVLALLDTTGVSRERVRLGYPGGPLQAIGSALFIPLQALPSLLGSPRSMDLTKALALDLSAIAFFGFLPTLVAYRVAFMRRAPSAARWLIAFGLLIPLTPLAGLLYHRVQILFVFGGVWAFAWYWENAREDRALAKLPHATAALLGLWLAASVATVALEPRLTEMLQSAVRARLAGAGAAGKAYPAWMLERAARLLPELRIWHPRQLAVVLAMLGSLVALRLRRRPTAELLMGACVTLELLTFAAGWVTFADPARYPPFPVTPEMAAVRERVGDGRVFVHDSSGTFFPSNTLAMYGIATIQQYESVEVNGMWQQTGYASDAASLARIGVSHALSRPGAQPGPGWTPDFEGHGFVLWKNDHPAPRYDGDGPASVTVVSSTPNRRKLEVPPSVSRIRVAENWSEGWRFRVGSGGWQAVQRSPDGSMLLPLTPAPGRTAVEMQYAPARRTLGMWISGAALLLTLILGMTRAFVEPRPHRSSGAISATLAVLLGLLMLPMAAGAQATPYVPVLDPAYRDLDALVASGLAAGLVVGPRPYSQATFARVAAEARARLGGLAGAGGSHEGPRARFVEALARLEARFPASPEDPGAALRGATLEASVADSPPRAIEARYVFPALVGVVDSFIDADLNPLLQRNQGREVADGGTVAAEAWGDVRIGSRFAAAARPRVRAAAPRRGGADVEVALVQGYARGVFGNLSVDLGRNQVARGHARDLGPVLSNNARGLDMARLSMERPGRLPWIFGHLGPVSLAGSLATLGDNRDNPGGVLIVWEGSIRPHRNVELGLTLLNQQGGEGAPKAGWGDRLMDAFFLGKRLARPFSSLPADPYISDKVMAFDAQLTLPGPRVQVYLEGASTDDHDLIQGAPRQALWTEAAWTGGVRWFGLGEAGRLDLWAEAGRNGVRPYTHDQFTSGMTLDRRILGSPLGPLATALQGGLDWTGPRHRVSAACAWERYSGDEYLDPEGPPLAWIRTADNPDEIRVRATLDWIREPALTGLRTSVRLGYERVTRFAYTDRNRSNFLAQVGAGWAR